MSKQNCSFKAKHFKNNFESVAAKHFILSKQNNNKKIIKLILISSNYQLLIASYSTILKPLLHLILKW